MYVTEYICLLPTCAYVFFASYTIWSKCVYFYKLRTAQHKPPSAFHTHTRIHNYVSLHREIFIAICVCSGRHFCHSCLLWIKGLRSWRRESTAEEATTSQSTRIQTSSVQVHVHVHTYIIIHDNFMHMMPYV